VRNDVTWWDRLAGAGHGVLATVHPERGVDAVPVVFAVDGGDRIVIPVDTVKAKRHVRLQRLANVAADPRCVLLVEHYDDDWSQLWWVRVHARAVEAAPTDRDVALLAERHPQYRAAGAGEDAVVGVLVLTPSQVTGWAAT
jgi:PPOX class probable F420-dependent enzyme